jgi:hypothetical protein
MRRCVDARPTRTDGHEIDVSMEQPVVSSGPSLLFLGDFRASFPASAGSL